MQGRLGPPTDGRFQCFPRDGWGAEFERAEAAGLDAIEWIYDAHGADVNPLATDTGLNKMVALSTNRHVSVKSLCADIFLDRPLLRASPSEREELLGTLRWLIGRCRAAGIRHMVLPFVDASRIQDDADADGVVAMIGPVLDIAGASGVELHLETGLAPIPFAKLLGRLPHPMLKANYDSGNSSSLGYAPREEFAAYGPRVGSVHIKDRVLGGGTVPLGTGGADFEGLFESLAAVGYAGDYILQVARDEPGHEVVWATRNRAWLAEKLDAHGLNPKGETR
jgi:hexulose-6-phosphate isomerase